MANSTSTPADIQKNEVETVESIHKPTPTTRGKDKAAELLAANERIVVTTEENKRVLRKIDLIILPILLSVYFLQSLGTFTYCLYATAPDMQWHRQDDPLLCFRLRSHPRCKPRSEVRPVLLARKYRVYCTACDAAPGCVLPRQVPHRQVRRYYGFHLGLYPVWYGRCH